MRARSLLAPVVVGALVWACSSTDENTLGGGGSSGGASSGSSGGASSGASGGASSGSSGTSSGTSGASGGTSGASGSGGTSGSTSSGGTDGGKDAAKDTSAPDTGPTDPMTAARATCVDKINAYRATLTNPTRAPLQQYFAKEVCTDGEAKSDGDSNTPHGAFGTCGETAQDECPGWPGPPGQLIVDCLAMMWAEGPGGGHYENMATTTRTKVSCGFYQTAKGDWWATQNFY